MVNSFVYYLKDWIENVCYDKRHKNCVDERFYHQKRNVCNQYKNQKNQVFFVFLFFIDCSSPYDYEWACPDSNRGPLPSQGSIIPLDNKPF
jgi:hypothetical protein